MAAENTPDDTGIVQDTQEAALTDQKTPNSAIWPGGKGKKRVLLCPGKVPGPRCSWPAAGTPCPGKRKAILACVFGTAQTDAAYKICREGHTLKLQRGFCF